MPAGIRPRSRIAGPAGGLIVAALTLAGCSQPPQVTAPIKVASAYVMQATGATAHDTYLIIANSGAPDQLLKVRSSAGGKVLMLGRRTPGRAITPTLSQIRIPAHGLTRLDPTGLHLEIVGSGRLHQGTDITLTLVFAHAGTLRVPAQVSNPQTGNSGYFGP
jgi:copper(I)-binding protein